MVVCDDARCKVFDLRLKSTPIWQFVMMQDVICRMSGYVLKASSIQASTFTLQSAILFDL